MKEAAEVGSDHYLLISKRKITQEKKENTKRKMIKEKINTYY